MFIAWEKNNYNLAFRLQAMKIRILGFALSLVLSLSAQAQSAQNALSFDGVNDYIDCGNNASIQITGNQITLEAWIYPTSWKSAIWQGNIIAKEQNGGGNDNGFMLRAGNNGSLNLTLGNGGWSELISSTNVLSLNTWQHIAGTYDGSYLRLYVNGNPIDSLAANININNSTSLLYIGDNGSNARHFPGIIEEVRIWNVERTKSELLAKMNDDLCGNELGLVANYRMNQGLAGGTNAISVLNDATGVNNGTLRNFTLSGATSNFVNGQNLTTSTTLTTISDTICNGDVYILGSQNITSAGTYSEIFAAANGCDSTVNLTLVTGQAINILVNANRKDSLYTINQNPLASYQWFDCGSQSQIIGATSSTFMPLFIGTFSVIITEGGCSDTSFCIAGNNGSGVGLADLAFTAVDVYPQPASQSLQVDLSYTVPELSLILFNSSGYQVMEKQFATCNSINLDCSGLKAGLYILQLEIEGERFQRKIVVED
jgi:hypothetical protein